MRVLVDAQLPRRLCNWLAAAGHDAVHSSELPNGNRTTDAELAALADGDARILVTKDDDFVQSRLVRGTPKRLWLIATGNIDNRTLQVLVGRSLAQVEQGFAIGDFVELGRERVTVRR